MTILVLESSTSSAKAMLYDSENGIIRLESTSYEAKISSGQGMQNADMVYRQTLKAGQTAVSDAGLHSVDIIALGGAWHSLLLCDKDMIPLTPTLTWEYARAAPLARELRRSKDYSAEYSRRTGCVVHGLYPAFKLMHLQQQGQDISESLIVSQGAYNFYQLSGSFRECASMASGTGWLDIRNKCYDPLILKELGIGIGQLGELTDSFQCGYLNEQAARFLGLKSGTPVLPAHPDGALNQVGEGALKAGHMTFSVGTSAALRLSSKTAQSEQSGLWCYLSPQSWLLGAASSGACNCVDWVKELYFPPQTSYRDIESLPIEGENLPFFLPFLFGERSPGWRDGRKGAFLGLTRRHGPAELFFSVLEGVLFNAYQCYSLLSESCGPPRLIKLSGGILNSPLWRQMCCNIFGVEMHCSTEKQASLMGAAALALHCGGALENLDDFSSGGEWIISPDPTARDVFKRRYQTYLEHYKNS